MNLHLVSDRSDTTITSGFAEKGYLHLKNYFNAEALDRFEWQIAELYAMQARKIGEYRSVATLNQYETAREAVIAITTAMEDHDAEALYQAQKFFPSSRGMRTIFDGTFLDLCSTLIGGSSATTLIEGPALFVNKPTVNRLLYHWHTEALYYNKRRRFVNIWIPMFGDRTIENGAMTIMPKSHKRVWDTSLISEYGGFSKADEGKRNQFWQLELPDNFLVDYGIHHCESKRGDVILFDRNLVHSSNANNSTETSFAVVARVWDPSDDLTLTGDMAANAFGGNIGRADLVVRP